jgi:hypothetical protein
MCSAFYDLRGSSISSRFIIRANSNHSDFRKSAEYFEEYIHCYNHQSLCIFQNVQENVNGCGAGDESAFTSICNSSNLCQVRTLSSSRLFSRRVVAVGPGVLRRCETLRACCPAAAACWCVACVWAGEISATDVLPRCRLLMLLRECLWGCGCWADARSTGGGGGFSSSVVDMYNATSNSWTSFPNGLRQARYDLAGASLPSGLVFFAGGAVSGVRRCASAAQLLLLVGVWHVCGLVRYRRRTCCRVLPVADAAAGVLVGMRMLG